MSSQVVPGANYPPHLLQRPFPGRELAGNVRARVSDKLHNNFVTRAIAEHEEAKAAPPWPRFHPVPAHPVFYPPQIDETPLDPLILGEFEPAS